MNSTRVTQQYHFRSKEGYKRPSVSVEFDAPDAAGLVELLTSEDPKVVAMLVDSAQDIMASHIKGYVDSDLEFNQAALEALVIDGKVSLEHIAHIPKADRNSLTKEDLETFATDYISVMPELANKDLDRVKGAASLFVERFKRAAGDNDVLLILQGQLSVFVDGAPNEMLERNDQVIRWAASKLEELLSIKVTADAL